MTIAPLTDVKARFSDFLTESERGPVVITRNGKAIAALIPLADDEVEQLQIGQSKRLKAILDLAKEQMRRGEGIAHSRFWAEPRGGARRKQRRNQPEAGK